MGKKRDTDMDNIEAIIFIQFLFIIRKLLSITLQPINRCQRAHMLGVHLFTEHNPERRALLVLNSGIPFNVEECLAEMPDKMRSKNCRSTDRHRPIYDQQVTGSDSTINREGALRTFPYVILLTI